MLNRLCKKVTEDPQLSALLTLAALFLLVTVVGIIYAFGWLAIVKLMGIGVMGAAVYQLLIVGFTELRNYCNE